MPNLKKIEDFHVVSIESWDGQDGTFTEYNEDGSVKAITELHREGLGYVEGSLFHRDELTTRKVIEWLIEKDEIVADRELVNVDALVIDFMKQHVKR